MITTENVNGRDDWYFAHAYANGHWYGEYMKTRQGAFMEVARQLANAGYLLW